MLTKQKKKRIIFHYPQKFGVSRQAISFIIYKLYEPFIRGYDSSYIIRLSELLNSIKSPRQLYDHFFLIRLFLSRILQDTKLKIADLNSDIINVSKDQTSQIKLWLINYYNFIFSKVVNTIRIHNIFIM